METMAYMLDTAEVEGKTVFRYLHMPAHRHLCAVKTLCYRAALLLSHALLAADFAESTLRLAYQESNKPYFENERNLHFSLSYSYQHAMCAISDEPIGYDVRLLPPTLASSPGNGCASQATRRRPTSRSPRCLRILAAFSPAYVFTAIERHDDYKCMVCAPKTVPTSHTSYTAALVATGLKRQRASGISAVPPP